MCFNLSRLNLVGRARGLRTLGGPEWLFYTVLVSEVFGVCAQQLGVTSRGVVRRRHARRNTRRVLVGTKRKARVGRVRETPFRPRCGR